MTKKDFFRILIKAFAIFAIISYSFNVVTNLLSLSLQLINTSGKTNWFSVVVFTFIPVILTLFFYIIAITKTDSIIKLLGLQKDSDIDEPIPVTITETAIVKGAILLVGLFFFIDTLPDFLSFTVKVFKQKVALNNYFQEPQKPIDYYKYGALVTKTIISFLVITNYTYIAKIVAKK